MNTPGWTTCQHRYMPQSEALLVQSLFESESSALRSLADSAGPVFTTVAEVHRIVVGSGVKCTLIEQRIVDWAGHNRRLYDSIKTGCRLPDLRENNEFTDIWSAFLVSSIAALVPVMRSILYISENTGVSTVCLKQAIGKRERDLLQQSLARHEQRPVRLEFWPEDE